LIAAAAFEFPVRCRRLVELDRGFVNDAQLHRRAARLELLAFDRRSPVVNVFEIETGIRRHKQVSILAGDLPGGDAVVTLTMPGQTWHIDGGVIGDDHGNVAALELDVVHRRRRERDRFVRQARGSRRSKRMRTQGRRKPDGEKQARMQHG
jgi:hypothetical protein